MEGVFYPLVFPVPPVKCTRNPVSAAGFLDRLGRALIARYLIMFLPDGNNLMTPHPSPKVTPSPQAPQGEDTGVQTKFCTDIAQSSGTRNAMVYANVTNRATGKFSDALALREATTVSSAPSNRATGKFSAALALREATTVSYAASTPGYRNMRIRSSLNSPLKLLCSGGRVRFWGQRPWSASSSAGTWCLRPP